MENTHNTFHFTALTSMKEQRLAYMAVPESPAQQDALEQKILQDINDPSIDQTLIEERISQLQFSTHLSEGDNTADWQQLREKSVKRRNEIDDLKAAQKLSTPEDADWMLIVDGIKGKVDAPDAIAVHKAKEKITFALGKIAEVSDPARSPHNAVAQTQAYNDIITKIQALDPENKITFVPNGLGGAEDDKMLAAAKLKKEETFKSGSAITVALENTKMPNVFRFKEMAKQALTKAVEARKQELWKDIQSVAKHVPQVVDTQKIIQEYLDQINELTKLNADALNGVPAVASVLPTPQTPTPTPNTTQQTPAPTPNTTQQAPTPTPTPNTTTETPAAAAPEKVEVPATKIDKKVDNDKITLTVEPKDAQITITMPDNIVRVEKAVNGIIVINNAQNGNYNIQSGSIKFDVKVDVKVSTSAEQLSEKEQTGIQRLIELFEQLLDFLRGERIANGGVEALQGELERIDAQIASIKKANPDFAKKPDISKQITDLEISRQEILIRIEEEKRRAQQFVNQANQNAKDQNLGVSSGIDKHGNPYFCPNYNVPGVTPQQSKEQTEYMANQMKGKYPYEQKGNRFVFNINGDVNINSKNSTNNSRVINNTNNVSGINNKASNFTEGSNNGTNRQRLEADTRVEPTQLTSTKNSRRQRVPVVEVPTMYTEPVRAEVLPEADLPPTGDLS